MRARLIVVLTALALVASPGCKRKKTDEVKKDKADKPRVIQEVPRPADYLGELVIKDPETFMARAVKAAGMETEIGPSPYAKIVESVGAELAKKALKAVDPHGQAALVLVGEPSQFFARGTASSAVHAVLAVHLSDREVVRAALSAAGAGGDVTSSTSKALGEPIYRVAGAALVVLGDTLCIADAPEALDDAARYADFRASATKLTRQGRATFALEAIGPKLGKEIDREWAKNKADIPPKVLAVSEPVVMSTMASLKELGDGQLELDLDGDALVVTHELGARGRLGAWLGTYPSGDATPLLTLPKGSASLYRFSDDLSPLIYAGASELMSKTGTAKDRADFDAALRALGGALGHELGMVSRSTTPSGMGMASFEIEYLFRLELTSSTGATSAKGAMETLRRIAVGPIATSIATKATTTPYKKFGAEGETLVFGGPAPSGAVTFFWAIKGNQLFLDGCFGASPKLPDAALDSSAKATLFDDPVAKAKIASFPTSGVVAAMYGEETTSRLLLPWLAPLAGSGSSSAWSGYSVASAKGLQGKTWMPLAFVGPMLRTYLSLAALPAGTPAPVPPVPLK